MFPVHLSFALPWARQAPWPVPGNRKSPQKQKWGRGGRLARGKEIWETKLFIHSPSTGIKKTRFSRLPEGTVLAGPMFAGEMISRFSRRAPVPTPAVRQGQGTASAEVWAQTGTPCSAARASPTGGWRGGTGLPLPPWLPRDARAPGGRSRSWDGLWGCGRGREGRAPRGRAPCGTRPGAIWRLRGARRGEPRAAAPPAAAAPARPPSAGPPPPAAGSC